MRILKAAGAGLGAVRDFIPRIWAIVRQVFNEIMGMVFFAIAIFFAVGAHGLVQSYMALEENPDDFPKVVLLLLVVLMFIGFGVSSFRRARKLSRER